MAGPFKLPTKENQDAEKLKRDSINKVKHWAELYIPAEVLQTRDCIVDVSEIQCGDPNCAPIDTVVRLLFKGNVGYAFSRFRFVYIWNECVWSDFDMFLCVLGAR